MLNEGFEYREILGDSAGGLALLDYLAQRHAHSSRDEWAARIESRRVLVDGAPAGPQTNLIPHQILVWLRPPWEEPEAPLCFAILHRDEHLLAAAKPSGLPTLPGGGFLQCSLLHLVRRSFPEANPMHRLGRATSGIVLFSRISDASSRVSEMWRRGRILKQYRALVSGIMESDELSVDVPIGPVPHHILGSVHAASAAGKPAHSRIKVLERRMGVTLVEVTITTGRPHQIRIHAAAIGHPLAGDPLYVAGGVPLQENSAVPGDAGYLLHAERLGLFHPATGGWLEITCMPPPSLRL